MKALLLILVFTSAAAAASVMVDADGHIIAASTDALTADPECTIVLVPDLATIQKDGLVDEYGRCKWTASKGQSPEKLATPEWPKGALKSGQTKRLLDKAGALLSIIVALERWQSDPANVAVLDRQSELDAALKQLAALRTAFSGK